jgi:hypothetical protein
MNLKKTMNMKYLAVPIIMLLASPLSAAEPAALKTEADKVNYAIGVSMINDVKQQGGEVNLDLLIKGMMDGLTGENLLMTEDELRRILAARQSELAEKQRLAANQRGTARATSADAGRNTESAVPKKQDRPEPGNDPVPSNATFANGGGQAQKTGQGAQSGRITPHKVGTAKVGTTVLERDSVRSETRKRAFEKRREMLQQRRGEV